MKKQLKIPKFKNEAAERRFWSRTDFSKYFDVADFSAFPFFNFRPRYFCDNLHSCADAKNGFLIIFQKVEFGNMLQIGVVRK